MRAHIFRHKSLCADWCRCYRHTTRKDKEQHEKTTHTHPPPPFRPFAQLTQHQQHGAGRVEAQRLHTLALVAEPLHGAHASRLTRPVGGRLVQEQQIGRVGQTEQVTTGGGVAGVRRADGGKVLDDGPQIEQLLGAEGGGDGGRHVRGRRLIGMMGGMMRLLGGGGGGWWGVCGWLGRHRAQEVVV